MQLTFSRAGNKILAVFLLGMLLISPAQPQSTNIPPAPHQPEKHGHPAEEIPEGYLTPQLELNISKDMMDGYNLELVTRNFHFVIPEQYNADVPDNILQGHAHLFINGVKLARLYGNLRHVPGEYFDRPVNQLSVFLNSDNHGVFVRDKKKVLATLFINNKLDNPVIHRFVTFPISP